MVLLAVSKQISQGFALQQPFPAQLLNFFSQISGCFQLFIMVQLKKKSIGLQVGSEVVKYIGVRVLAEQLLDDQRSLADSPLAEVDAG